MKKHISVLIPGVIALATLIPHHVSAVDLQIDRSSEKFNLGVSPLIPASKRVPESSSKTLHDIVSRDLEFSRLFNLVKDGPEVKDRKDVGAWAQYGSQMVLSGEIKDRGAEEVEINAELVEVASGKVSHKIKERGQYQNMRILGHTVANRVVEYFTGQPGIFNSKIAYVNDASGRKELFLADYDGQGRKKLTNDNSIVILPRIAPDGSKLVFTSYSKGNPDLYIMNTDGTSRRKLSAKTGLNVSPSWSPNNQELAVTLSLDGPPNIYLIDMTGKIIRRLTDSTGADTAPTFSPDGQQIGFTSDRDGAPHIYVVGLDGSGLRRLTTDGHCDSAAWSPDNKAIVYVKGKGKEKFDIYSIEVLTGIERRLTWGEGDNENPAWSPDSRSILFTSTRRGKTELYTMAADGGEQKPLGKLEGQSFTPHWSR